jgi:hypothetical protein
VDANRTDDVVRMRAIGKAIQMVFIQDVEGDWKWPSQSLSYDVGLSYSLYNYTQQPDLLTASSCYTLSYTKPPCKCSIGRTASKWACQNSLASICPTSVAIVVPKLWKASKSTLDNLPWPDPVIIDIDAKHGVWSCQGPRKPSIADLP